MNLFSKLNAVFGELFKQPEAGVNTSTTATLIPDIPLTEETWELLLEETEERLLKADVGLPTTLFIMEQLEAKKKSIQNRSEVLSTLKEIFKSILNAPEQASKPGFEARPNQINIIFVVGVNGAGKTTFIGKLAHQLRQQNLPVLIAAADTFRAAAEEQLSVWAERANAEILQKPHGADPGAVVYEALDQTLTQYQTQPGTRVLLIDTAGRLQNKFNLMEELQKLRRIIQTFMEKAPGTFCLESFLVLDAATGQNGLQQASVFKEAVQLTGVVLTKLDGSAKGGVVLAIAKEDKLPIKLVGVGESIQDLIPFDAQAFVSSILGEAV